MLLHMYVQTYIRMFVRIHTYVCTYMRQYIMYVHAYVHVYVCIRMCVSVFVCSSCVMRNFYAHMCIHMYIRAWTCALTIGSPVCLAPQWFFANYFYQLAFLVTTVGVVNTLSSLSGKPTLNCQRVNSVLIILEKEN